MTEEKKPLDVEDAADAASKANYEMAMRWLGKMADTSLYALLDVEIYVKSKDRLDVVYAPKPSGGILKLEGQLMNHDVVMYKWVAIPADKAIHYVGSVVLTAHLADKYTSLTVYIRHHPEDVKVTDK